VAEHNCGKDNCRMAYAVPFAIWDLRLYLDTHPDDREAIEKFRCLCREAGMCCACCGPMSMLPASADDRCVLEEHWNWIDGPWPWEPEANCGKGCD